MYRFLVSWRWLGAFLLALAVAAGCVFLAHWQWDRREQRLARNALVEQNYDRTPVSLGQVLEHGHLPPKREWTPVRLSGSYLPGHAVLLRNRPLDGRPGYHSLVPFVTDDGPVLLVDRGWLPTGESGLAPDQVPAPPRGKAEVVVRLRPAEPTSDRGAPRGQLQRITPAAVSLPAGEKALLVEDAYGVLSAEQPPPATSPQPLPEPELDEGPHLSYALQWFVFAIGALVGFVVVVRRSALEDGGEGETRAPRAEPQPVEGPEVSLRAPLRSGGPARRPRRASAEEEEDALVDAQLRRLNGYEQRGHERTGHEPAGRERAQEDQPGRADPV